MSIEEQRKAIIEDASRKEFEESQLERGFSTDALSKDAFGIYFNSNMRNDWLVWQAARNQSNTVPVGALLKIARGLQDCATHAPTDQLPEVMRESAKLIFARLQGHLTGAELLASPQQSNQSNNVPFAWHVKSSLWDYVEKDYEIAKSMSARGAKITPLYTSPQQSNALEMALCKAKQSLEFIASITKDEQTELSSGWSDSRYRNLMGLRCYRNQVGQTANSGLETIRALTQPESTAPQQAIPRGLSDDDFFTLECAAQSLRLSGELTERQISARFELANKLDSLKTSLSAAPQPESDGK